jgi:hypothetical protein
MKLRIGDKVRFLNEVGEGVVSQIKDKFTVYVEMNDGFEIPIASNQLVPIYTELIIDKDSENIELNSDSNLNDAIYFVIEPDHELPSLINDYKIYIFNSSSFIFENDFFSKFIILSFNFSNSFSYNSCFSLFSIKELHCLL